MGQNNNLQNQKLFDSHQKLFSTNNGSFDIDGSRILIQFLKNQHFFAHNAQNLQLQVLPPIIQEKKDALEKLIKAIHDRCHTEVKLSKLNTKYPCHDDQRAAVLLAEKKAYEIWIDSLPVIPQSYSALCDAIKKRQTFAFEKNKRKLAIHRINLYAKLAAELHVPNNNNPSIITHFRQQWNAQLDDALKYNKESLIKRFEVLLETLDDATDENQIQQLWQQRLEYAHKKRQINFIKRFNYLIKTLKNANDKNQSISDEVLLEAMSRDKNLKNDILLDAIGKAIEAKKEARINLAKYLRSEIKLYLNEIAAIDEALAAIVDQTININGQMSHVILHTRLIETESFTDCIFTDLNPNLGSPNSLDLFLAFKKSLEQGQAQKEQLGLILQQLTLKRNMIYASIDWKDKDSVISRSNHANVVSALAYLYHFLPEYADQLDRASVNYKDENADIKFFKETVIQYIDRYVNYFNALRQQEKNTVILDDIDKNILGKEINRLYGNIQNEVKNALLIREANEAQAQTTKTMTYLTLNM